MPNENEFDIEEELRKLEGVGDAGEGDGDGDSGAGSAVDDAAAAAAAAASAAAAIEDPEKALNELLIKNPHLIDSTIERFGGAGKAEGAGEAEEKPEAIDLLGDPDAAQKLQDRIVGTLLTEQREEEAKKVEIDTFIAKLTDLEGELPAGEVQKIRTSLAGIPLKNLQDPRRIQSALDSLSGMIYVERRAGRIPEKKSDGAGSGRDPAVGGATSAVGSGGDGRGTRLTDVEEKGVGKFLSILGLDEDEDLRKTARKIVAAR